MDPVVLLAMVDRCAVPEVPRTIVYAVALAESGGHRFVIRDNTTKTVHRFHGINAALVFMKTYPSHSLDIGLMQVNTRAHRVDPGDISPCQNIRIGSEILVRDTHGEGTEFTQKALCLYHTGKQGPCRTYLERVESFLHKQKRKESVLQMSDRKNEVQEGNPVVMTEGEGRGPLDAEWIIPSIRESTVDVGLMRASMQ